MSVRSLPPLAQIRAFAALAETGSMSAAGSALNVSHAAVSQQVRALEDRLGVKLTCRDGRGLGLTDEGARLAQTLTAAFASVAAEVETLTASAGARPLQVSLTPMFAAGWLMPRIADFQRKHPEVELMLHPSAQRAEVGPGGVDLALRYGHGNWPGVEAEMLVPSDFLIMGATSLLEGHCIESPRDLIDFPWLQELGTNEIRDWLAAEGITDACLRRVTHLPGNLLLDGLRAGQGLAATSRTFVTADLENGTLVELFTCADFGAGYFIVTPPGPLRPSARAFVKWLREQAADETVQPRA